MRMRVHLRVHVPVRVLQMHVNVAVRVLQNHDSPVLDVYTTSTRPLAL